ncbi:helix-turn-helix domain-containing protein [Streptomyces huiliensis]|uniref:helix-turn-helix domain-containing protein n=1 Tax=Streptomyces huiliensis TaxID=2876027 RepID=UPI001CBF1346|nr:hypothetical protein [Streptomyces huiliensis]
MSKAASRNALLVAVRVRHGWHTQQEFADAYERHARALGANSAISVRQVRRWESGRSQWPNRDARRVLHSMFGLPLEQLGFARPGATAVITAGEALATPVPVPRGTGARARGGRELVDNLTKALERAADLDGRGGPGAPCRTPWNW